MPSAALNWPGDMLNQDVFRYKYFHLLRKRREANTGTLSDPLSNIVNHGASSRAMAKRSNAYGWGVALTSLDLLLSPAPFTAVTW